jgi:hypothetical protein
LLAALSADTGKVRQLNPSTNLVLAVLAGLGLLASLSLDWFAAPVIDPTPTDGPVERGAFQVSQVFATHAKGTVSGNTALGSGRMALVLLVVLVAILAAAVSVASLRRHAEDALHLAALATPVVVIALAAAHPGTSAAISIHYGLLVSLATAIFMASASWHGASMRQKHAAPTRPRYGVTR